MAGTGDLDALKALRESRDVMRKEIGKIIVGQEQTINELLIDRLLLTDDDLADFFAHYVP